VIVRLFAPAALLCGKGSRYPLTRRIGGPHRRAGFFKKITLNCFGNRNTIPWCSNSLPSHHSKYPRDGDVTTLQAPFLSLPDKTLTVSSTLLKLGFHDLHYILHFEYFITFPVLSQLGKFFRLQRIFLKLDPLRRQFIELKLKKLLQFQCLKLGFVDNCHKLEYLV